MNNGPVPSVFCHQCSALSTQATINGPADRPLCPECGSEFVECRAPAQEPVLVHRLQLFMPMGGDSIDAPGFTHTGSTGTDASMDAMLQQVQHVIMHHVLGQPQRQATAASTIEGLPRLKVQAAKPEPAALEAAAQAPAGTLAAVSAGQQCAVCHDDFVAEAEVVQLPCRHCFHEHCILPWLEGHNTCPVCRKQLQQSSSGSARPEGSSNAVLQDLSAIMNGFVNGWADFGDAGASQEPRGPEYLDPQVTPGTPFTGADLLPMPQHLLSQQGSRLHPQEPHQQSRQHTASAPAEQDRQHQQTQQAGPQDPRHDDEAGLSPLQRQILEATTERLSEQLRRSVEQDMASLGVPRLLEIFHNDVEMHQQLFSRYPAISDFPRLWPEHPPLAQMPAAMQPGTSRPPANQPPQWSGTAAPVPDLASTGQLSPGFVSHPLQGSLPLHSLAGPQPHHAPHPMMLGRMVVHNRASTPPGSRPSTHRRRQASRHHPSGAAPRPSPAAVSGAQQHSGSGDTVPHAAPPDPAAVQPPADPPADAPPEERAPATPSSRAAPGKHTARAVQPAAAASCQQPLAQPSGPDREAAEAVLGGETGPQESPADQSEVGPARRLLWRLGASVGLAVAGWAARTFLA